VRHSKRLRRIVTAAGVCLTILVQAQTASAGTYLVSQCDYELGITANSFVWNATGIPSPVRHAGSGCGEFGLAARSSGLGTVQTYADSARGGYVSTAPDGTVFTRFRGAFGTLVSCCAPGLDAYAEAREFTDGAGARDEIFKGSFGASTWPAASLINMVWEAEESGFGAGRIGYFVGCANSTGCMQSALGDVRVRGRSFEFMLNDLISPEIRDVAGSLTADGWVRGEATLSVDAVDEGGGLSVVSARLGDQAVVASRSTCAKVADRYVDLQPCPLDRDSSWTVDTTTIEDGAATLEVQAEDVGGANVVNTREVLVDNTPPARPTFVTVLGRQNWRSVNGFDVRYSGAEQAHAPVTRSHYRLCATGDACVTGTQNGDEDSLQLEVPAPGRYSLTMWLEDAAGNQAPATPSDPVELLFDDVRPGRVEVDAPLGWLSADEAGVESVPIEMEVGAEVPVSGIAGYSLSTEGRPPDETIDAAGAMPADDVAVLPEGETVIHARAVSGSGVASDEVGTGIVRIDRTPPSVVAEGVPKSLWSTHPLIAQVLSVDQPGLSGVQSATNGHPITEGGHIEMQLDMGPTVKTPGAQAQIAITTDGTHELTYRAFDVAGNGSVEKEAVFRVDRTAPVGSFRALDPADPQSLKVDVADATSGLADGWIEYRRAGDRGFKRLATTRDGGVLTARLDDSSLKAGRYELRAIVHDVAGNEAVVRSWADGTPMMLAMPLRLASRLEVAGQVDVERCARTQKAKGGGGKGRRKPKGKPRCRATKAVKSIALAYQERAKSSGILTTAQGAPIAHAPLVIEGQPRSGGAYARLGTTSTDARGRFRFTIPAGSSRTVRYRYDGTDTIRPAAGDLTTKVKAAARLKVDRRRLRNGQAVRFRGRLLGRPIPPAGKLVALQAKVGRSWRTFATPRANASGRFRHRYRFTATTGLRRYAFRVVVAREAAYPYEKGVSRIVKVTVRGR
jgi:hypothetical protein